MKYTAGKFYKKLKGILIPVFSILSIVIGGVGTYISLKEDKVEVTFEVIKELDVLSLKKNVKDLEVLFRKKDIVKEGLSLKSLYIVIKNTGDKNLKKEDFDTNDPWRIEIIDSKDVDNENIESEIVGFTPITSNNYLKGELKKINISEGHIALPFFMFDKGKFFILEIIVLHKKDTLIKPEMYGKISGMDNFTFVTKKFEKDSNLSIFFMMFQGGSGVQLVRILVYFTGFIVYITLVVLLFEYFKNKKKDLIRRYRRKSIYHYLTDIVNKPGGEIIVEVYLSDGIEGLRKLKYNLSHQILKFSALAFKLNVDYRRYSEETRRTSNPIFINPNLSSSIGAAIGNLMDSSLIYQKKGDWTLDKRFRDLLDKFIQKLSSDT